MDVVSIQYLRAVAAMMVVVHHLHLQLARLGYDGSWPQWLPAGVDIFFVISGTIMWLTTAGRAVTPGRFMAKRIVRIVPLYWLLTSVVVAVMVVLPAVLQTSRFALDHVVASYLFVPWRHPATGLMEPALIPGWTLNYEMFFYLLFGLALALPAAARLAAVTAALLALVGLQALEPRPGTALAFYSSSIVLEFACGMALAWAYRRGLSLPAWAGALGVAAGFALLALDLPDGTLPRLVQWGFPAVLIVAGAVSIERRHGMPRLAFAHVLGDASYSLYLSHTIVLAAFGRFALDAGLAYRPAGRALFAVTALAVVTIVAILLYRLVERPLLGLMSSRPRPQPEPP